MLFKVLNQHRWLLPSYWGGNKGSELIAEQKFTGRCEETSACSLHPNESELGKDSVTSAVKESGSPSIVVETSEAEPRTLVIEDCSPAHSENVMSKAHCNCSTQRPAFVSNVQEKNSDGLICDHNVDEGNVLHNKADGSVNDTVGEKSGELTSCAKAFKPTDAYLNVRLPDGSSIQAKFLMIDPLRLVKDYVDETGSCMGPYDLAIPYPRKVFNDRDMDKQLSELGFVNREALIVVPHHSASGFYNAQSSSLEHTSTTASDADHSRENGGSLFGYVKKVLSVINPFSYVGGSGNPSNSEPVTESDLWQYRPNPGLQASLSGRPYAPPNLNSQPASENASNDKKATTSRFGSNIHTLKRDDDEGRFRDMNAFWNGNSTQYGGDNGK